MPAIEHSTYYVVPEGGYQREQKGNNEVVA